MRALVAIALTSTLSALLGLGCQTPMPKVQKTEGGEGEDRAQLPEAQPPRVMHAAGLSMKLPPDWEVMDSHDPNFAMALTPSPKGTQTFSCVIEMRRQGRGELSRTAKLTRASSPTDLRYNQGPLHGRLREFPGPHEGAAVLAHCRGPRSSSDWGPIDAALDALRPSAAPTLAKSEALAPEAIVEMCVGSPSRKTHVCARRQDGAVYCGMSAETKLERVDVPAALQISCDGIRSCSRDAAGQVSCWKAGEAPALLPELGKVEDLAGGCAVDEHGSVSCRMRREDGMTMDSFAKLEPLGDAAHQLEGVSQVLAGSSANTGCVIANSELRCWDAVDALGLGQAGLDTAPQRIAELGEAVDDLVRTGDRLCTQREDSMTCYAEHSSISLPLCTTHACGCDLVATSLLSCEYEPHARLDSQTYGHIYGVTAVAGACAGLGDGRVLCRGPAPGERSDSEEIQALVTGKVPGILHSLALTANE